jgi:hypothetical protein
VRKLVAVVAVVAASALLASCGSSSSSSSPSPPPSTPVSGTVGGKAFTPAATQAISATSGTTACTVPVTFGASAIELALTSYGASEACTDLLGVQCASHASSQAVTIFVAKVNLVSPTPAPTVGPGTYPVTSITGQPEAANPAILDVAYAEASAPDPSCAGTAHPVTSGSIRLDQVSGPVTGHLDLTFDDGSKITGDFSATMCAGTPPNVCMVAANAIGGHLCVPQASCTP